jgi:hypothetical protein
MHGLAVKAAYTVGLHSKEDYAGRSERQRETRKRAWWGCVTLDRFVGLLLKCGSQRADIMLSILSMTFGRPLMIPASHCRVGLPEPIENEVPGVAGFDIDKGMSVSFLSASM